MLLLAPAKPGLAGIIINTIRFCSGEDIIHYDAIFASITENDFCRSGVDCSAIIASERIVDNAWIVANIYEYPRAAIIKSYVAGNGV